MDGESYDSLKSTLDGLRAENERLKAALGCKVGKGDGSVGSLCQKSPSNQKLALFMQLFRGREDVFAKQWHNANNGKSGFSPVCLNEWSRGVCDKKKYKCQYCPSRRFVPPDSSAFFRHLSGKSPDGSDIIQLYPLMSDDSCYFAALSFFEPAWREDLAVFRSVCEQNGLSPAVERSGENSARAWFFFEERVPAALARSFVSAILTDAMALRHELPFELYDHITPSSDSAPHGFFGTPVALPLQGLARRQGKSVFVDEELLPYSDQWSYLSGIKKLTHAQIDAVVKRGGGTMGDFFQAREEEEDAPWLFGKQKKSLAPLDFPEKTVITLTNMLHIPKAGLSQQALNTLRRLAAFLNPEFAMAERKRLPTRDLPRVVDCSRETRETLSLPRGCEAALRELLDTACVNYAIDDKRSLGRELKAEFAGVLRPEQIPAANAMLEHENGVLAATTAFGKTVLAAYLIASLKRNTLILVHTTALMEQWKKALEQFLEIDEELPVELGKSGRKKKLSLIGRLGGGRDELHGVVDIAVMQSLTGGNELPGDYGLVIADECHHVSAVSFERVLRQVRARYIYGLSATPARKDGLQPIIFMQCGPIRYRVNALAQAQAAGYDRFVIPRFTQFRLPDFVDEKSLNITELYNQLAADPKRNELIIKDVRRAMQNGRIPLVLTRLTAQVDSLAGAIEDFCPQVIRLTGKAGAKQKREALERLRSVPQDGQFAVVATGQFVGEGFDEPRLDSLFLASPVAWHGTLQQYAGRLHRATPGKKNVMIFDYVDMSVAILGAMFHKRIKAYREQGYRALVTGGTKSAENSLFDGTEFWAHFARDICSTKREIVILSPKLKRGSIDKLLKTLSAARINGVSISILTRPAPPNSVEAALIDGLRSYGIQVFLSDGIHQNAAVLDRKTVWYGSVSLLGYSSPEASIMRFENADVASELLSTGK